MMDKDALDRHITGNYGEDQFDNYDDECYINKCQVNNCDEDSEDGVLCSKHQPPQEEMPR
jgi:hypothetical protein